MTKFTIKSIMNLHEFHVSYRCPTKTFSPVFTLHYIYIYIYIYIFYEFLFSFISIPHSHFHFYLFHILCPYRVCFSHLFHILCPYRVCFSQKSERGVDRGGPRTSRKMVGNACGEFCGAFFIFFFWSLLSHFPSSEPKISLSPYPEILIQTTISFPNYTHHLSLSTTHGPKIEWLEAEAGDWIRGPKPGSQGSRRPRPKQRRYRFQPFKTLHFLTSITIQLSFCMLALFQYSC
jgi:hypothetical protein